MHGKRHIGVAILHIHHIGSSRKTMLIHAQGHVVARVTIAFPDDGENQVVLALPPTIFLIKDLLTEKLDGSQFSTHWGCGYRQKGILDVHAIPYVDFIIKSRKRENNEKSCLSAQSAGKRRMRSKGVWLGWCIVIQGFP